MHCDKRKKCGAVAVASATWVVVIEQGILTKTIKLFEIRLYFEQLTELNKTDYKVITGQGENPGEMFENIGNAHLVVVRPFKELFSCLG